MNDEFGAGFALACVVWIVILLGSCALLSDATYTLSWNQNVCVKTTDNTGPLGTYTETLHCVAAPELAQWAVEKGR